MARTDTDKLVVELEARIRDFEKGMQRSANTADKQFSKMQRSAKKAAAGLESTMKQAATRVNGALGAIGLGGIVGGAGVAGIVATLSGVAKGIAEIGDEAKRAGLSNKAFQELAYVAKANRIEVDALTDGMKELSLRADEYIATGKGSAAESFQRLGLSVDQLKTKLKDPSALFTEIIGKLGQLDRAAQIRIADELFGGTGGEKFVQLIGQGEDGIKATIQEAHNLNAVLSDDVIASAAELDRKFNQVATTVGNTLKSAIVSAAESLTDFINAFKGFEFERTAKLDERMASLGKERLDVERQILELKDKQRRGESVGDGIFGTSIGESTALEAMADYQRRLEAIAAEEQMIGKVIDERRQAKPAATPWVPPTPPPGGFGGGGGGRDKAAAQAEREAKAVRDLIAELEEELRLVGATNTEKEISANLRRVNIDATSAEGQQIASLITQINAETEARDKAKQAAEQQKQAVDNLFQMSSDAIGELIDGSAKASDVVKKLAAQLAIAAAQAALLGTGPLAGLFGGGGGGGCLGGSVTFGNFTGARL